ncbi:unnamed protein product [Schistocephalus solidus]|uniref:BHLH domain-containing protein n=1 Tax=Schistocephalus solidus TaxID=70667 RepID=A0A3P7CDV9_SCHSO|nr:unnamed protein product [Schistocephalus solidus]
MGTLLPEDMFRDGDCKKNKGSILKNSVEYICALRAENSCFVDLRREATLATGVITKLVKRIQDLESFLAPEYLAKVSSTDYQTQLQEWASTHEANQQRINTTLSSPVPRPACVSLDTSESSPGMSSIGNEDLGYPDTKGVTSVTYNTKAYLQTKFIPKRMVCSNIIKYDYDKYSAGRCHAGSSSPLAQRSSLTPSAVTKAFLSNWLLALQKLTVMCFDNTKTGSMTMTQPSTLCSSRSTSYTKPTSIALPPQTRQPLPKLPPCTAMAAGDAGCLADAQSRGNPRVRGPKRMEELRRHQGCLWTSGQRRGPSSQCQRKDAAH